MKNLLLAVVLGVAAGAALSFLSSAPGALQSAQSGVPLVSSAQPRGTNAVAREQVFSSAESSALSILAGLVVAVPAFAVAKKRCER